MGDEVVLIYEATGRVVRPGGLPIEEGVAVFNVETMYNIYNAVENQKPVTSKLVSVVAEVEKPVTVRVPLGCTIEDVVEHGRRHDGKRSCLFCGRAHDGIYRKRLSADYKDDKCSILVLPKDHNDCA